jgi:excisionase family DNA binding protein
MTMDRLLNGREVADILRVDYGTVKRWSRDGTLPKARIGAGTVRFRPQDVQEFIDSRIERPADPS